MNKSGNQSKSIKKSNKRAHAQKQEICESHVIESDTSEQKCELTNKEGPLENIEEQEPPSPPQLSNQNHKFNIYRDCLDDLSHQYAILRAFYHSIIAREKERLRDNEQEIDKLKKYSSTLEMEKAEIKRKRVCYQCDMEATMVSSKGSYIVCSQECEILYESSENARDVKTSM